MSITNHCLLQTLYNVSMINTLNPGLRNVQILVNCVIINIFNIRSMQVNIYFVITIDNFQKAMFTLRSSSHRLMVETGRYYNLSREQHTRPYFKAFWKRNTML